MSGLKPRNEIRTFAQGRALCHSCNLPEQPVLFGFSRGANIQIFLDVHEDSAMIDPNPLSSNCPCVGFAPLFETEAVNCKVRHFLANTFSLTSKCAVDVLGKSTSKTRRCTSKMGLLPVASGRAPLFLRPRSTPCSSSVVTLHSVGCGSRTSSGTRADRSPRLG